MTCTRSAGLSIARTVRSGSAGNCRVRIDATGAIQSLDGSSYDSLLARICGENPARAAAISAGIRAVGAGQADTFSLEFPCRLPDREMRVRLVATPYRQGAVEGVLLAHTDADAAQYPQAYKMEALGRVAGGVAHDFANLVTLISGYSDILLNRIGAQDPSRPELEEREQVALPTIVQLNALVVEMMRLLRPIIGEHISLVVTLDPNLGVVKADFAQMTRVVMNLVLNARDAMPHGGSIGIRTATWNSAPIRGIDCRPAATSCWRSPTTAPVWIRKLCARSFSLSSLPRTAGARAPA